MCVHHLANMLEKFRGESSAVFSQQINRRFVLKYSMVNEMSSEFCCVKTFQGYPLDHSDEPIGDDKEIFAISPCSEELSKNVDTYRFQ